MCPHCKGKNFRRFGSFQKASKRPVQRFLCMICNRTFSAQTASLLRGQKKTYLHQNLFRLLCSGMSQRRCAKILGISRTTVARKVKVLGSIARSRETLSTPERHALTTLVFDEMETFEHSKCKPLSIVVAVDEGTRKIFSLKVASMPAKGHLAAISRRKYGFRRDDRAKALGLVLSKAKSKLPMLGSLKSDECPRYPRLVRRFFKDKKHETFRGRRGCVVGQGELKRGGFDPLFALNHTCAMIRDNIKRLSRRTWCTTKKPASLQDLLDLYLHYHNENIRFGGRLISL